MAKIDDAIKEPEIDPSFAGRMEMALDSHPRAPAMKDGRLTWLQNELKTQGMQVSLQTVHRWYHGLARPRNKKMIALAKALRRDPIWLADGRTLEVEVASAKRLQVLGDGAGNCLIGFIQLEGWQCAIPEEADEASAYVSFYAIIKGRQHRIHVSKGLPMGKSDEVRFAITSHHEKCKVLGVCRTGPFSVEVVRLPSELITKHAEPKDGHLVITAKRKAGDYFVGSDKVESIKDFKTDVIK